MARVVIFNQPVTFFNMKRAYRLRRPDQFQRVRREGRNVSDRLLILNASANRRRSTRCGFVVGKRIGQAVVRNRAKRRVREAVRLSFSHIAHGYDLVFVIRTPDVAEIPFPALQNSVEQLLRRAQIWQDSSAGV
jgi:ribonuclease P protein component